MHGHNHHATLGSQRPQPGHAANRLACIQLAPAGRTINYYYERAHTRYTCTHIRTNTAVTQLADPTWRTDADRTATDPTLRTDADRTMLRHGLFPTATLGRRGGHSHTENQKTKPNRTNLTDFFAYSVYGFSVR